MIPALGGLLVAALRAGFSFRGRGLGPTLGEHVQEVETEAPLRPAACVARSAAAVGTLGTGNSLGPEGPCVEIGASVARSVVEFTNFSSRRRKRQLLAAGPPLWKECAAATKCPCASESKWCSIQTHHFSRSVPLLATALTMQSAAAWLWASA